MGSVRLIPTLLLKGEGFYKTVNFSRPRYLGDPLNILRLFNEKEADELCILDIAASREGRPPDFDKLQELADECFMPLAYGGGLTTLEECRRIFSLGFEKVVLNSVLASRPELASAVADVAGAQAVTASIDVRRDQAGAWRVWTHAGGRLLDAPAVEHAQRMAELGAGEILLTSIDREGAMTGYDLELIAAVAAAVDVPVVANGGAGCMDHLCAAVRAGASAVAAGSMVVYVGRHRAVLINPPGYEAFQAALAESERGDPPSPVAG
jgi:imidazole glycerol-phosphate synthase subunit HisF